MALRQSRNLHATEKQVGVSGIWHEMMVEIWAFGGGHRTVPSVNGRGREEAVCDRVSIDREDGCCWEA